MLFIELAILLLILGEVAWRFPAWKRRRHQEKELKQRLASLESPVAAALRRLILDKRNPEEANILDELTRFPPLIERDYLMGWRIVPDFKEALDEWVKKKV
jgi:hypothetical protein